MDTLTDGLKYLDDFGIHLALVIAGMFGAFVMMGKKEELNFWHKLVSVISGGGVANYLTPLVFDLVNLPQDIQYGVGFILGYFGLESVKFILHKLKDKYTNE